MIDLWITICMAFGLGNCGALAEPEVTQPEPTPVQVVEAPVPTRPESNGNTNSGTEDVCVPDEEEQRMLDLVNTARASSRSCGGQQYASAPALTWNCKLRDAARSHTQDMADTNFFSHSGSDGLQVSDRVTAQGYDWRTVGENIAAGQDTAAQAMDGWIKSAGHCRNIMNPEYVDFGSALEVNELSDYYSYWGQAFAAPFGSLER